MQIILTVKSSIKEILTICFKFKIWISELAALAPSPSPSQERGARGLSIRQSNNLP